MSLNRKSPFYQKKLSVESLESRSLLSGIHAMVTPRVVEPHPVAERSAHVVSATSSSSSSKSAETHLVANLADASGASTVTATAKFESELKRGVEVRELSVQVKGATAGAVLSVSVIDAAGTSTNVGNITVKADGTGRLQLKAGLPQVAAGATISISAADGTELAKGTFAVPTSKPKGGDHQAEHSETHLLATVADPNSKLTGTVKYESETEHGLVLTELKVQIKGATPGAVIDVSVTQDATSSSVSLGKITIGADGTGRLKLNSGLPALSTSSTVTFSSVTTAADGTTTTTAIASAMFTLPTPSAKKGR
ncbi:MAG: hypothetical protein ACO1RA_22660 [Planctomycetaceae bacterium]